ncbi:MAG: hypothetical protein OXI87_02105 [Albidovulum sp.]|nr:hypothetical protein [Albidovulum sp.]
MARASGQAQHMSDKARDIEAIDELPKTGRLDHALIKQAQAAGRVSHVTTNAVCGIGSVGYDCAKVGHSPLLAIGSTVQDVSVRDKPNKIERRLFRLPLDDSQRRVVLEEIEKATKIVPKA